MCVCGWRHALPVKTCLTVSGLGVARAACSLYSTVTPTKTLFMSVEFHGDRKTVSKLK